MKNLAITFFVSIIFLFSQFVSGQKSPNQIKVKATVVDSVSNKGVAFATLSLLKMPEKNIIHKMITGDNGKFQLYTAAGD